VSWSRTSQADRDGAAIKLMTDAGYGPKKPLNIRLAYPTSENRKRLAVAAAMWKKLGVNVELVQTELKVLTANLRQGDFEIGTFAWGAEYNDAREFLYFSQTSAQQNWPRFSNPDYDRLMDEAAVTSGQAKRAQLLEQGEQILLRELPFLPLFFNVSKNLAVPAQLVSALLVTGAELLGEKDARPEREPGLVDKIRRQGPVPASSRRPKWRRLSRRHWTAADTVTISLTAVSGAEISGTAMKLRSDRRL
jgi:ABC-type oligopeptide transport system substrate-binding subunit